MSLHRLTMRLCSLPHRQLRNEPPPRRQAVRRSLPHRRSLENTSYDTRANIDVQSIKKAQIRGGSYLGCRSGREAANKGLTDFFLQKRDEF